MISKFFCLLVTVGFSLCTGLWELWDYHDDFVEADADLSVWMLSLWVVQ